MILEELSGETVFCVTRNGKCVELAVGDTFTDEEYLTRTYTGKVGKATIRIDQNCTIEINAVPAVEIETTYVEKQSAPQVKVETPTPVVAENTPK